MTTISISMIPFNNVTFHNESGGRYTILFRSLENIFYNLYIKGSI